jgi:hypothetical protein
MKLTIVAAIAAAAALAVSPATAKSKKHHHGHGPYYGQTFQGGYGGYPAYGYGWGWNSRNVSDPSNVSPGYLRNQALGRCVEDLGYGRYEYCGW